MSDDLVKRLREDGALLAKAGMDGWASSGMLLAADRIESLQQAVAVLEGKLATVAASEDNEITSHPYWMIIDPRQMMSPDIGKVASMFVGPFFSRKAATDHMNASRYRYGKHVKVFCCTGRHSEEFAKLYEASLTLATKEQS